MDDNGIMGFCIGFIVGMIIGLMAMSHLESKQFKKIQEQAIQGGYGQYDPTTGEFKFGIISTEHQ